MINKIPDKSKTIAVLLAVFLGYWTWLYTSKFDLWKFWIGIGLTILGVITYCISLFFGLIFTLGVYIWTIVDTTTKSDNFYNNYWSIK
jgi:hypothetical protein